MADLQSPTQDEAPVPFKDFLETVPPGRRVRLDKAGFQRNYNSGMPQTAYLTVALPWLSLHCTTVACDRVQNFSHFKSEKEFTLKSSGTQDLFFDFYCRNCVQMFKTYSIRFTTKDAQVEQVFAQKFGEMPQFGPPLPAKLLQLAGIHGDLLKKGRQSENQSLGIGAFAYYRRVVEDQKSRLIDEL